MQTATPEFDLITMGRSSSVQALHSATHASEREEELLWIPLRVRDYRSNVSLSQLEGVSPSGTISCGYS